MICENCGNEVPEHKVYCGWCGRQVRVHRSRPAKYSDEAHAVPRSGHLLVSGLFAWAAVPFFVLAVGAVARADTITWAVAIALNFAFSGVACVIASVLAFKRMNMSLIIVLAVFALVGIGVFGLVVILFSSVAFGIIFSDSYGLSCILIVIALVTLFFVGEDYDRRRIAET